ncbi:NAD(P)H-dependent oxidoreductase [Helicobacter sp. faydin-H20]|uniref:NAD(P)H-dependent oxidoreductase n=1 Tax=Helicobacter anatolicus TaxID=2905874 RepID=UPI001E2FFE37|nr:NAD(P)H-dependent oxidoreductase [Helicobacter anatolicus]MCE3036700.1 NAD(P)H-dependent oxidoreductase [Helicobacter anatolicus]
MKTLILFAHTFWKDSKVNKALLESAKSLNDITIHNISTTYSDGNINIPAEIELLNQADKIIFQFPLFWFSVPSLLKEWQDRVLTAILYGENKDLLKGKKFQIITTLGGAESSYDGHHKVTLEEILKPIYHALKYCGCEYVKHYAIFQANVNNLDLNAYHNAIKLG